jgi:hypothetical protein
LSKALAGLTPADEKALAGVRAELRRSFANQQVEG